MIPASRQSRVSRQLIDWLPLPTHPDRLTDNYFASAPGVFDRDSTDAKVNWNASTKLTMFGALQHSELRHHCAVGLRQGVGRADRIGQQAGYGYGRIVTMTYGANYIVSPNLLLDGNFGFTRMAPSVTPFQYGQNIGLDVLKIPGTNGPDPLQSGIPHFAISGYETLGNTGSANPYFWRDNQFQYNLNTTWIKGAHSVRFGLDITRQHMNHTTAGARPEPARPVRLRRRTHGSARRRLSEPVQQLRHVSSGLHHVDRHQRADGIADHHAQLGARILRPRPVAGDA